MLIDSELVHYRLPLGRVVEVIHFFGEAIYFFRKYIYTFLENISIIYPERS